MSETATQPGVVNDRRASALAEIYKAREDEVDRELKEGGNAEGLAGLQRDGVADGGDPLRPADVPVEDWAAMSDEAKNEAIAASKAAAAEAGETDEQRQAREEQEAKDAEAAESAAATQASAGKKVKIKVDGVEQEVDEAAVLQAGVQTLQKERAADKRLEDAAAAKAEAERLRAAAATAATPAAQPAKKTDQEMLVEKDALRGIVKAIQYGTPDEAVTALEQYGQRMSQLGQANAITAGELENMLDLREAQQFVKTNYADVVGDANLKKLFVSNINEKLAAGDARPYQEIAKDVGDELRTWKGTQPKADATQTTPSGASRAAVHQRKTSTVQVPTAAARQPAPTQPKALSPSEVVARQRAQREKQSGRLNS